MSPDARSPKDSHDAPSGDRWQRWSAQATVAGGFIALASLALAVAVPLGWLSSGLSVLSGSDSHETPIGQFLVSLPFPPTANERYWTKELAAFSQAHRQELFGEEIARIMTCFRPNTARMKQALKLPGARSGELEKVAREITTPAVAATP